MNHHMNLPHCSHVETQRNYMEIIKNESSKITLERCKTCLFNMVSQIFYLHVFLNSSGNVQKMFYYICFIYVTEKITMISHVFFSCSLCLLVHHMLAYMSTSSNVYQFTDLRKFHKTSVVLWHNTKRGWENQHRL